MAISATYWDGLGNKLGWVGQRIGMGWATNWDGLTATATFISVLLLPL